jgi:uncharacterized YkwD family protein
MKNFNKLFIFILFISLVFTGCMRNKEPVKGVESSVNETGDVKAVKITADKANVTLGCDPNSQVLQTANKNTNFNVLNKVNNDWYAVQLPNNQIGFVPKQQCTAVLPQTAKNKNLPTTPNIAKNISTPTPTDQNTNTNNNNMYKPKPYTKTEPQTPRIPEAGMGVNPPDIGMAPKPNNNSTDMNTPDQRTPAGRTPLQTTPGKVTETPSVDPNASTPNTTPETNIAEKPNKTTNQGISNQEQEMLNLINQSRKQNGLKALTIEHEISEIARIKSKDMIDSNYFSHNSPTYGNPFDMLKNFGVSYLKAGENIAGNTSVQKAHEALMNSPGHRKNILSPDYTHVGIGIVKGGNYGNMFTQLFISK